MRFDMLENEQKKESNRERITRYEIIIIKKVKYVIVSEMKWCRQALR